MDEQQVPIYNLIAFLLLLITFITMNKRHQFLLIATAILIGATSGVSVKIGKFNFEFGEGSGAFSKMRAMSGDDEASTGTIVYDVEDYEESKNSVESKHDVSDPEDDVRAVEFECECECPEAEPEIQVVEKVINACDSALAEQVVTSDKARKEAYEEKMALSKKYDETQILLKESNMISEFKSTLLQNIPVYYQKRLEEKQEQMASMKLQHETTLAAEKVRSETELAEYKANSHASRTTLMRNHADQKKNLTDTMLEQEKSFTSEIASITEKYEKLLAQEKERYETMQFEKSQELNSTISQYELTLTENQEEYDLEVKRLHSEYNEKIEQDNEKFKNDIDQLRNEYEDKMAKESAHNLNKETSLIEKHKVEKEKLIERYETDINTMQENFSNAELENMNNMNKVVGDNENKVRALIAEHNKVERKFKETLKNQTESCNDSLERAKSSHTKEMENELESHTVEVNILKTEIGKLEGNIVDLLRKLKEVKQNLNHFVDLHEAQGFCNSTLMQIHMEQNYEFLSSKLAQRMAELYVLVQPHYIFAMKKANEMSEKHLSPLMDFLYDKYDECCRPFVNEMNSKISPKIEKAKIAIDPHRKAFFNHVNPHIERMQVIVDPHLKHFNWKILSAIAVILILRYRRRKKINATNTPSTKKELATPSIKKELETVKIEKMNGHEDWSEVKTDMESTKNEQ